MEPQPSLPLSGTLFFLLLVQRQKLLIAQGRVGLTSEVSTMEMPGAPLLPGFHRQSCVHILSADYCPLPHRAVHSAVDAGKPNPHTAPETICGHGKGHTVLWADSDSHVASLSYPVSEELGTLSRLLGLIPKNSVQR